MNDSTLPSAFTWLADDDLDRVSIPAVKMSDMAEARQYGVKSFPSIIVFVKRIPELYHGV